jgi:hypothetical protein
MDYRNPTPSEVDAVMIVGLFRLFASKRHPICMSNLEREIDSITKVAEPLATIIDHMKSVGCWPQPKPPSWQRRKIRTSVGITTTSVRRSSSSATAE